MIETSLVDYGIAGAFILYLIYDRHILIKGLVKSIDALTHSIEKTL